jgi:hypothetical protein
MNGLIFTFELKYRDTGFVGISSVRVVRTIIYGANTVAFSEETESNGENNPAPKGREAHFYSTQGKHRGTPALPADFFL